MIEKWKYLHFIIGPRGKIYIPAVIRKTQIRGRDQAGGVPFSSCSFFFSLFFIHFEGMQVHCTTKTQHQAMESSRAEEMELLWRRRALYREERASFKGQLEVVQSDSGTRCHSQMSAINHSLVIPCQTSKSRPFSWQRKVFWPYRLIQGWFG